MSDDTKIAIYPSTARVEMSDGTVHEGGYVIGEMRNGRFRPYACPYRSKFQQPRQVTPDTRPWLEWKNKTG